MKRVLPVLLVIAGLLCFTWTSPCATAQNPTGSPAGPPILDGSLTWDWTMIPFKVTKANFGKRVSRSFYAIQVELTNNSGKSVWISTMMFKSKESSLPIPIASLKMVQGRASGKGALRISESGFHEDLLVGKNTKVSTVVFVPRRLFGSRELEKQNDPMAVKNVLGALLVLSRRD